MLKHKPEVDHDNWASQLTLTRQNYSEHSGHTSSKHNFVRTLGFESSLNVNIESVKREKVKASNLVN